MRFHGLPETLLGSPARVSVLKALFMSPDTEWTGRQLARAAGVSPTQAMAALRVLEWEGICWQRVVGRASLWRLDKRHILFPSLRQLARLDETARGALRQRLDRALRKSGAEEAYLFGSVAERREKPGSDVDVLVVFPNAKAARRWQAKNDRVVDSVRRSFSSVLQVLVYTRRQVRAGQGRHLLGEARRKGVRLEVR